MNKEEKIKRLEELIFKEPEEIESTHKETAKSKRFNIMIKKFIDSGEIHIPILNTSLFPDLNNLTPKSETFKW